MWPYHGLIALDLANERAREAREEAARWRVSHQGHPAAIRGGAPRHRAVRAVVARPIRAFSDATHSMSDAACRAATRIEGRTA